MKLIPSNKHAECVGLAKAAMAQYYEESGLFWESEARLSLYKKCELFEIVDEVSVGYLLLRIAGAELYIGDLQVLPEHQNRGVGTYAVKEAVALAKARNYLKVKLKVFKSSPAKNLYVRHGFSIVAEESHVLVMELNT